MKMKKLFTIVLSFGTIATSILLNVPSAEAIIKHRWSFNDNTDSIGSADASLINGASLSGGSLNLDGINDHVNLPIGSTISSLDNATIEAWVTWDTVQTPWARVFDFGSGISENLFLTPRSSANSTRLAITIGGGGSEQQINSSQFPVGVETHVAITIDGDNDIGTMYINGIPVSSNNSMTLTPSDLGSTTQNYLGRSQYSVDPFFDGSISEFRIYDESLSAAEINSSFVAGADSVEVPFEISPTLGILIIGGFFGVSQLRKNLAARKTIK